MLFGLGEEETGHRQAEQWTGRLPFLYWIWQAEAICPLIAAVGGGWECVWDGMEEQVDHLTNSSRQVADG